MILMKTKRVGKIGAVAAGAVLALGMGNAARNKTPETRKDAGVKILSEAEAGQRGNIFWFSYNSGFYRLWSPIQAFGSFYPGYNYGYGFPASFYGIPFAPHILYSQFSPYATMVQPSVMVQQQSTIRQAQNDYDRFGLNTLEPPIPNAGEPSMGEKLEQQMKEQAEQLREQKRLLEEQGRTLGYVRRSMEELKRERQEQPVQPVAVPEQALRFEFPYIGRVCDVQLDDAIIRLYDSAFEAASNVSGGKNDLKSYDEGNGKIGFRDELGIRVSGVNILSYYGKNLDGPTVVSKALEEEGFRAALGEYRAAALQKLAIGFRVHSCGSN